MIENEYGAVWGLVCLGLLVLWIWSTVLVIQAMRRFKEWLRWSERMREKVEDLLRPR